MKLYDTFAADRMAVVIPGLGPLRDAPDEPLHRLYTSLPAPTVIDIANVAAWYWRVCPKGFDTDLFPNVAPPWGEAWFEYPWPTATNLNGLVTPTGVRGVMVGVYMHAVPASERDEWRDRDGWMTSFHVHSRLAAGPLLYEGALFTYVSPEGGTTPGEWTMGAPQALFDELGQESISDTVQKLLVPVLMALSFAHCRNVSFETRATPPKVAKKRVANGKPPGVTYKTLVIDGMKETLRTEGGIEKNGLKKALHICRGHFATYTADRPLFGKITGTVWKPMHTRGAKERGEVKKDYKITAA